MERITHQLTQGSPEWHLYRARHDNASDAAAMLNCSPYKTRNELLHERWLGLQPEFSDYVQERVLDRGHTFEHLARPLAEAILGETLFPVTMSLGSMSASLDGHTFDDSTNWEHKSLNEQLLAVMPEEFNPGSDLPKFYRVQMEHQFIPSGAEQCLFTASKWNGEDLLDIRHAWYYPDAELRAEIVAGWEQFHKDLAAYVPPEAEKPKPAGKRLDQLPALRVTITDGKLSTDTNLAAWKAHALKTIGSVNRSLVTDEDFATAENMVKWCETVETNCDTATAYVRSQVEDIDAALRALEDVKAASAKVRNELSKLGDRRKKERKEELVGDAVAALHKHVSDLNQTLAPYRLPAMAPDFQSCVKGKSKFANMKNDLDSLLAKSKIEANDIAEKMRANIAAINAKPEFLGLFADAAALILQPADHLALVIRTRIADHEAELKRKAEEAARAAEEKIRADERARIEAEERERRAQAERDEQERIRQAEAAARQEREAAAAEKRRQDEDSVRERAQADADLERMEPTRTERVAETVHSAGLPAMEAPTPAPAPASALDEEATLKLGDLSDRWGCVLSAKFIAELGVHPRKIERAASLYSEGDWLRILQAIEARARRLAVPF